MSRLSPEQMAQKWATNLANASNDIKAGVLSVTQSPTEKAANRADAYVAGVQRAVADGTWQAGLRRVSLQQWQEAMIKKGIPVIAERARMAVPKMSRFLQLWMTYQQGIQQELLSMPRGTLEQNIQRANHVIRRNAEFKTSGQRGFLVGQ